MSTKGIAEDCNCFSVLPGEIDAREFGDDCVATVRVEPGSLADCGSVRTFAGGSLPSTAVVARKGGGNWCVSERCGGNCRPIFLMESFDGGSGNGGGPIVPDLLGRSSVSRPGLLPTGDSGIP